jgi:GT2 family glycosyltransferase
MSVRISIVTPSYNQAQYIEQTLRSVLSQRQHVHEYFVLDGGSTDGSVDIIKRYADSGAGIDWWTSQRDKGQSDAIHRGFARATGDFLFWLNSDDVVLPNAIARAKQALESNPSWDVLTAYHVRTDESSRIISAHRMPRETPAKFRRGIMRVCQQTCFFRRSLYEAVGLLNLDLHCVMDTELWYRMMAHGSTWGHIPEYLAGYRWHSMGKTLATAWVERYEAERQALRARFPQFHQARVSEQAALLAYRLGHVASGRYPRAKWDSHRFRGKAVTEVFGEWMRADHGRP